MVKKETKRNRQAIIVDIRREEHSFKSFSTIIFARLFLNFSRINAEYFRYVPEARLRTAEK
jgi:hypothetical protein